MFTRQHSTTLSRTLMQPVALFALVTLFAACASSSAGNSASVTPTATQQPSLPSITIKAKDYSFDMPDTLQAGLVDVTMMNEGTQPHQVQFARLNDGVTQAQTLAALKKGLDAFVPLFTFEGGANTVDPGQSQQVILNLPAGQYMAQCFVSGSDNIPHLAKGMYKFFTVTGSSTTTQASMPQVSGQVSLKNFSFVVPTTINAGSLTWQVTNQGTQPHEMDLLKLAPGKDVPDMLAFLRKPAGPPPFTDAGGMGALAPGLSAWVKLNLTSGKYVALCFVPDPTTGKPHFALGMMTSFTVH
jgi:uncharacterized cupredoxin-like copper-binding protein